VEFDRKLLEQGAAELFENAPCGYLATLADGTIIQVNQTFVEMSGHDRSRLLAGFRFSELLTVPGRIYHDTHFGPLLQMQGFVKEVAFELLRSDGHRLPVLVNAMRRPAPADGGTLTLIVIFEATDRRQYEQELLLARRRAEAAAASERAAKDKAERAIRAKDDFLAMISHELRTPLNAILGWTQILRSQEDMTDDLSEGLSVIERNAQVQTELINDLLDMSRISSGKMRLNVQNVGLSEIIEAALDTARPAADAKGLRLQKVLDPDVMVSGDPGRLQQVFWNLLINAIKFTPKGGSVRVVMHRVNSHIEVSVIDSGQGMTEEFLSHAFEMFRQSESGETQKSGGLGLGLSIVKNLVEMHGGSIRAMSEGLDKGSTFRVELPLLVVHSQGQEGQRVNPRAALADGSFQIGDITLKGVSVLVVDDEQDAREVIRRVLTASGATVTAAGSAAEALQMLDHATPDVLISDVGLPGEDGYELIRKIRMRGNAGGRIRAVALTAFARLEDRTKALMSGYQMHLAKPVDARELIVTVATLAGK
jgi:PAS domain S-box-containing protein